MNFGDTVDLLGYDMSPRAILPGEAVTVTLYWRSTASFPADFQVFLNAIRPNGRKSAEATGKPLGGTLATTQWPVGQVITDVRDAEISADGATAGLLDIEVGWFLPGADRLSVLAGDGHEVDTKQLLSKMRVRDK